MTEFQREIGCVIVLLAFSLGCFGYVEIVRIEATGLNRTKLISGSPGVPAIYRRSTKIFMKGCENEDSDFRYNVGVE